MRATTAVKAALLVSAFFFMSGQYGNAQVVAEPALLTAGIPEEETLIVYASLAENSYVLGGMIRFPVGFEVDVGGRAGLWLVDDTDDTPFAGVDARYGLLARPLTPGGGQFNLSFDVGLGVSDARATVWKIPIGFITGFSFRLAGGASEIFIHPRVDLGVSSGEDKFDAALLLDLGGVFALAPSAGAVVGFRFGKGVFDEGKQAVVTLGAVWRM